MDCPWWCVVWCSFIACAPLARIQKKPCQPGCVDETTRLECTENGALAVSCPDSSEPCAASACQKGACIFRPAVGAACGPSGLARCNEGYACLGPDLQISAMMRHTCLLADDRKIWCWGENGFSQLGDGTVTDRGTPVLVRGFVRLGFCCQCRLRPYLCADSKGKHTVGETIHSVSRRQR